TERKQAEAALLASKAKLEAALASMTDAVFISDVEGHFIEFNEAFATFHKFKSKEECAKTFAEYPNILDVFMANGDLAPVEMWAVPRALRGEIGTNVEYSLRRKDTGESWVGSYSFAPIRDEAGTIVGSVVVGRDITERKKMEDDLRQSEDKFSKAFKSSPAALLITRLADGRFLELNDAYSAIVGYERAELIGRLTTDFKIYLNSADRQAIIERLLATGSIRDFETAIRHRSGATRHVIAAQELLTFNGEACILNHLLDITERKQAEAEIRQLNAELEQRVVERTAELTDLYNNAPCGYHSLDAEGVFVRINDTELRWLGYSREEILGKMKATDLFTPASVETFRQVFPVFKTRGWMENVELDMIRKDGSILSVLLSATVITDQTGDYLMSRSTMIDYTDRKRAEAALRKTQTELQAANKELEAFSYSVSHDLRAPLRAIDGFSQALLEDYTAQLDAEGQRYLQRVRAASQRMAELIDDLLTLSRIARSEMHREAVNLSELAQAVIETLGQAEPERAVEVVIAPGLVVWADARLLRAALENLLGNAWKFTARQPQARIELGRMTQTDQTVYFVRDNGAGFDMAYADKLFGAFQRLHSPADFAGSGIGLATVQRIIHRHGGRIWAEGEVDHGATFYFTLSESRNDRRDHHE
ncbi:MAG TPA: PAS domain S-box protein, partial [Anaerolineae bacterium]|nr:PAS domain S-box protein [Anaerolineae bacterium]